MSTHPQRRSLRCATGSGDSLGSEFSQAVVIPAAVSAALIAAVPSAGTSERLVSERSPVGSRPGSSGRSRNCMTRLSDEAPRAMQMATSLRERERRRSHPSVAPVFPPGAAPASGSAVGGASSSSNAGSIVNAVASSPSSGGGTSSTVNSTLVGAASAAASRTPVANTVPAVPPLTASHRNAGLVRLPNECGTPKSSRRAENGVASAPSAFAAREARKHSMCRLPDDPAAAAAAAAALLAASGASSSSSAVLPGPSAAASASAPSSFSGTPGGSAGSAALSSAAAAVAAASAASSSSHRSRIRDRLSNKALTVNTTGAAKAQDSKSCKVFRIVGEETTINDLYDFGEEIYSGGAKGRVLVAKRRCDGVEVVVKIRVKHTNRSGERAWKAIMAQVHSIGGSQHVLDIIEIIECSNAFYVVMPKCRGGELFEFLATETEVPEAECKRITREILTAVGHLHKNNLVHRDIKPENIMFDMECVTSASPKTVKLIDFDTCLEWTPMTPKSRRFVGTPGYIAPEALLGEISPQSDLWSVGVILYILMTGEMPWSSLVSLEDGVVGSAGATQMYNALKAAVVEWEQEPWPDFPLARDLCQRLLAFDQQERPASVQEALNHKWLAD